MHLTKNYKNYICILINLIFFLNIILFFTSIFYLKHSITSYLIFSVISIFYFYYTCLKFHSYTELYISIFLYLGFWFKCSIFFILNDYTYRRLPESPQSYIIMTDEYLNKHYSEVFNISSLSILIIFFTFFIINNFILSSNNNKFNNCRLIGLKNFFLNNKIKLYFSYIFLSLLLIFLNYFFSVAYRGKTYLSFDIIEHIFKIFLFFGILVIGCLFLEFEDKQKNIKKFILYNVIQGFLISISIHSRAMIFEQLVIFSSVFKKLKKRSFNIKFLLFLTIIFFLSVAIVSIVRSSNSNKKIVYYFSFINDFFTLGTQRWVGIDGLSTVISYKEKGLNFYLNALKETNKLDVTFYEKNFFKKEQNSDSFYKSTFVPGFIAFIYYSDSILILIITLIFLISVLVYIERVINYLSMNSSIVTNYLAFVVVWRIIHFGVYPVYTFYYYLIIIFFVFCIYFSNKLLNKYYDR